MAPTSTTQSEVPEADTAPAVGPAIRLAGVTKSFRTGSETVRAVNGVDLEIERGEFFSLLGPSGCGKTTTMRMIAGFEDPTGGVVHLDGRDVTGVAANHRDVNMVFQSYALFPHMSVADNVAFGLRRKRVPKAEVTRRVGRMLDLVELGNRAKHRPSQLSGGQQQRVALARALVNEPSALLLDEPLGALDLKLRQSMQVELKRIQREVGITFVYVTHDQGEALTMSDRIAVMNNGVVEQLGAPAEIYERPATRFVADFIGTSNLVRGVVGAAAGRLWKVEVADGSTALVAELPGTVTTGSHIHLTVRPEKIHIGTDRPEGDVSRVPGTVAETVYTGAATQYQVDIGGGEEITVYRQNASGSTLVADRGERVWLSWRPEHSYALPS
ncbi:MULTISPECIES: ABC transporter ATP-binding protein [Nocardiopsis]|uniref:Spermidine/putrescine import ATP-binding protein PotA n=1 Tax=Nocardiopsis sinuspersici TaxID=501010 RepID=A0A1V3C8C6_9ACTN|nr:MULTISPECIES: ABC transporter ATP-binding protein [Nocardiopsis]NYH53438.1 spermidine/putrescine transport system ATP-binding protein [Nocardiopsis sinuspersici]OOC56766.1 spermidine/putrescine ABC transporter ATP-binding protein [Nocardiopsis sinuspersici]